MIDCSDVEIRDQLPDLVNGRLTGKSLAEVQVHLVDCDACQAEVRLLERARAVLIFTTPRVDPAAIARALRSEGTRSRRQAFNWRIAATIAILAVGGGSAAVVYARWSPARVVDSVAMAPQRVDTGVLTGSSAYETSENSELSISGDLSGLTDAELRALLGKVEAIEALPAADVRTPSQLKGVVPVETPGDQGGEQ